MLIYKLKDLDIGFAGVFLCDNPVGNVFLKQIENDAHDIWSASINPNYKNRAIETLREIKNFIRKRKEKKKEKRKKKRGKKKKGKKKKKRSTKLAN